MCLEVILNLQITLSFALNGNFMIASLIPPIKHMFLLFLANVM
jgi:hypothetical protein